MNNDVMHRHCRRISPVVLRISVIIMILAMPLIAGCDYVNAGAPMTDAWFGNTDNPYEGMTAYNFVTWNSTAWERLSPGGVGPAGPAGPTGPTGATGAAGPNSVNSSTTSTNITGLIKGVGGFIQPAIQGVDYQGRYNEYCRLTSTLTQNVTAATSPMWLVFTGEESDTNNLHVAGSGNITIASAGYYFVKGSVDLDRLDTNLYAMLWLTKNETTTLERKIVYGVNYSTIYSQGLVLDISTVVYLNVNNRLALCVYVSTTVTTHTRSSAPGVPIFEVYKIGE